MAFRNFRVVRGTETWDHGWVICDEDGNLVRSEGRDGILLFWGRHEYPNAGNAEAKMQAARDAAQVECDRLNAEQGKSLHAKMEAKEMKEMAAFVKRKKNLAAKRVELAQAVAEAKRLEAESYALLHGENIQADPTPPPADNPVIETSETISAPENKPQRRGRPKKAE